MAVLCAVEAKVWLLHLRSTRSAVGSLSFNVIREICSYFHDPLFAALIRKIMQLYDFNHNTTHHTLPIDGWSGYVQVNRTTVLLVGKKVLTLDLLTLQITPLPPLLTSTTCNHLAVESFSSHSETFSVLPVSLPEDLELGGGSVTFMAMENSFYSLGWRSWLAGKSGRPTSVCQL